MKVGTPLTSKWNVSASGSAARGSLISRTVLKPMRRVSELC